jgi:murein DD-endopeptidase MepM/ murein hydrolase activator NlpD
MLNPPLAKATALRLPSNVWKKLSDETEERIKKERKKMREILEQNNNQLSLECWKAPLKSSVSSIFASPRVLPSGQSYYHTGLDLRAAIGYPVRAPATSTVVVAEENFVPGKIVVLDHGGGLFSRYMHLDSIDVRPGDLVKQNQVIGRTGATGRVEAPHLHWEVLWKGNYANPESFLQAWEQICDPKLNG